MGNKEGFAIFTSLLVFCNNWCAFIRPACSDSHNEFDIQATWDEDDKFYKISVDNTPEIAQDPSDEEQTWAKNTLLFCHFKSMSISSLRLRMSGQMMQK